MKDNFTLAPPLEASKFQAVASFCSTLPPLPSVLRYYDEFDDSLCSIKDIAKSSTVDIRSHGRKSKLSFAVQGEECSLLLKHVFVYLLAQDLSIRSVENYFNSVQNLTDSDIEELVDSSPTTISFLWKRMRAREISRGALGFSKHLLQLLCVCRWNGWSPEYQGFIRNTLPLPFNDKYAAVRTGDVFLDANHEAAIVRYFDEISHRLNSSEALDFNEVADAGMVVCAYQFAMRPFQIGKLARLHVRIWNDGASSIPTVHLTFHQAKQRGGKKRIALTRRVKREWAPIFVFLNDALDAGNSRSDEKFFLVKSSNEAARRIAKLTRSLINEVELGSATDLRHTAAQRLVDAGASHEELAEFMGHAQINTGLVYYASSTSHAERVNKALGASPIYQQIAKIAHDKFISSDELAKLKNDQQIAAVPHGIPIAGIGGCSSGQPACPYNPVTSCYGCRKFMPLMDMKLHSTVLGNMREIVLQFAEVSRGDINSPAYMQLQRTIAEVQAVIDELAKAEP